MNMNQKKAEIGFRRVVLCSSCGFGSEDFMRICNIFIHTT